MRLPPAMALLWQLTKNVETARFDGKPVLFAHVDDGIHKPEQLLQSAFGRQSSGVPFHRARI